MAIIVVNYWYPPSKVMEVGKKTLESMQKNPIDKDKALFKPVIIGITRPDKEGIHGMSIVQVRGKVEDAAMAMTQRFLNFTSVDGFKFQVDLYAEMSEAMGMLGMNPPTS